MKKAYFVAPLRSEAKEKYGWAYKEIVKTIKEENFEIWDDVNKVDQKYAHALSDKEINDYFSEVTSRIRKSSIFVAEISIPSSSVGYEVGFAIENNIPVLLLRHGDTDKLGAPFRTKTKLLNVVRYNDENIQKEVRKVLKRIKKGFFVKRVPIEFTARQVEYIQERQASGAKRISFNAAVREIIDENLD